MGPALVGDAQPHPLCPWLVVLPAGRRLLSQSLVEMALWVAPSSAAATPVGGSGGRTAEVNGIGVLHGAVLAHLKAGVCTFSKRGNRGPRSRAGGEGPAAGLGRGRSRGGRGARSAPAPRGGQAGVPQVRGGGGGQSAEPQPSRRREGGGAMACAGLLTVCLIRPPAPEPPRPPAPAPAGHALFQDVSGERAGGSAARGCRCLRSVSPGLCLLSPCVSPGSLSVAVSPCPCLCVSLALFFPVAVSVSPSRSVWGPACLWVSVSLALSLTLLPLSVCLPLSHCLHVSSLLVSGSVLLPLLPPTPDPTPSVCLVGWGLSTLDHVSSLSVPLWQSQAGLTLAGNLEE